ncbi:MAG: LysR family transcriptional regulator [Lachnospiraceae bacterium]|nr:LysR family transcriptional regulator [Lachnospiraceae bacterium]MBR1673900.1 LysR family transcriptional regulator [Eubacterium sp.]
MTIVQLETFLRVSETKNFTLAAGSLGYAQSTVTTQIKQLEDELGCLLFERLGKTIVMTPAGERLREYAEKLLQLEREIYLEVSEEQEPAGVLKFGVSESFCYNRLPHILMKYKEKYPKVEIRLQFITHDTFPEFLKKGELDIVYTLNPAMEDESLKLLHQNPETLGFYVQPGHPLTKKKKIKEEDLREVPLLLTSHNCSFRQMLLTDFEAQGITPDIALETSSKEILKQFARNGLGAAFMPDMAAEEEISSGRLVRLNWGGNAFPVFSQVFVHKDKRVSFAISELVELIKNNE